MATTSISRKSNIQPTELSPIFFAGTNLSYKMIFWICKINPARLIRVDHYNLVMQQNLKKFEEHICIELVADSRESNFLFISHRDKECWFHDQEQAYTH